MNDLLRGYGYGPAWEARLNELAPGLAPARVVRADRTGYRVMTAEGEADAVWPAGRRHRLLDTPVIGDWVALSGAGAGQGAARIEAVLPRQTSLMRAVQKGHRTQPQVLAANADLHLGAQSLPADPDGNVLLPQNIPTLSGTLQTQDGARQCAMTLTSAGRATCLGQP